LVTINGSLLLLIVRKMDIHKLAIVHEKAKLGKDVTVGPFSIIGENVTIGAGSKIGSHVIIDGWTETGENCQFFTGAIIGTIPQDLKFAGEKTILKIGNYSTFREYVTVNRGTGLGGGQTIIGDKCLLMAYTHIAHDCIIGNNVIFGNAATLGGHIEVGNFAIIGGLTGIHQFVRIGAYSIIGGCSAVNQDIIPYARAAGNRPNRLYGLNLIGLKRHKFSSETIRDLEKAYRILFRSNLNITQAIQKIEEEIRDCGEVTQIINFIKDSKRGICKHKPEEDNEFEE
jgi:UDP-N-acetylglucosamine acyltransferase